MAFRQVWGRDRQIDGLKGCPGGLGAAVKVRVLGLDGTLVKIRGQEHGIIIALDLGSGQQRRSRARVPEHDVKALLNWLEPLVKACGVEVIVRLCRLPTYNLVAQALDLRQAHCRFHLKRRVGRLIKTFEAELGEQVKPILDEVRRIIDELPQDGGKRLLRLGLEIKARFDQRPKAARPGATLQAKAVYLEVIPAVG